MIDFVVYQNENVTGVLIFFFCKNFVRCVINSGIEKKVPGSGFLENSYPIMQYDLFPFSYVLTLVLWTRNLSWGNTLSRPVHLRVFNHGAALSQTINL